MPFPDGHRTYNSHQSEGAQPRGDSYRSVHHCTGICAPSLGNCPCAGTRRGEGQRSTRISSDCNHCVAVQPNRKWIILTIAGLLQCVSNTTQNTRAPSSASRVSDTVIFTGVNQYWKSLFHNYLAAIGPCHIVFVPFEPNNDSQTPIP